MLRIVTDRAINTRLIRQLYRSLLRREPEPNALDHFLKRLGDGLGLDEIADQILSSPEFQARRGIEVDILRQPAVVPRIASPAPSDSLHIVVVTADGFAKVLDNVRLIAAGMGTDDVITVLDGSGEVAAPLLRDKRIEVARFPGESVFHLRMHLPSIARGTRWMTVIEDHIAISFDWINRVRTLLSGDHDDCAAFVGSMANLTSISTWSWASFLLTFGSVWHPIRNLNLVKPHGANVIFPCAAMPATDFQFGEYESRFLPSVCGRARMTNEIWIDHIQHCGFARAVSLHFHSARVAGARMRMGSEDAMAGLKDGLARLIRDRVRNAADIIAVHPLRHALPRFTLPRMHVLTMAIAIGFVTGSALGYGRSPWKLE